MVRAELVAIYHALKTYQDQQSVHILTYSLTAIQKILLLHSRPHTMTRDHHYTLLTQIAQLLEHRGSKKMPTSIRKIRAHSGIRGNEQADEAAKAVVDALTKQQHNSNSAPPQWILTTDIPKEPTRRTHVLTDDPPKDEEGQPAQARVFTTRTSVNQQVKPHYRKHTAPPSQYHKLMQDARLAEDPTDFSKLAIYISSLVRKGDRKQAKRLLSFVWGAMYTQKQAYWFGHSKDQLCPLCSNAPDSCTHVGSGCYHPHLKALYMDRHAAAVRIIRQFIVTSPVGASTLKGGLTLVTEDSGVKPLPEDHIDTETLMEKQAQYLETMVQDPKPTTPPPGWHVPTDHRLEDMSIDLEACEAAVQGQQSSYKTPGEQQCENCSDRMHTQVFQNLPSWILPEKARLRLHQNRQGYRPDLVFVKGAPSPDPEEITKENTENWEVTLIEVGFCADLRLIHKKGEKQQKYSPLIQELQNRWTHVRLITIPIGNTGSMLQSTKQELAALVSTQPHKQLEIKRAEQLARTLVTMAAARLYGITAEYYRQRRKKEQQEKEGQPASPQHRKRPRDQEGGEPEPKRSSERRPPPRPQKGKAAAQPQLAKAKWKPNRSRPWSGARKNRNRAGTAHTHAIKPTGTNRKPTSTVPQYSKIPPEDYHNV